MLAPPVVQLNATYPPKRVRRLGGFYHLVVLLGDHRFSTHECYTPTLPPDFKMLIYNEKVEGFQNPALSAMNSKR